jgi:two-component system sensor histidine kinase CpxA
MTNASILIGVMCAYIVSLLCGFAVANVLARENYNASVIPTYHAMDELELEEARSALEKDGPEALGSYLNRLDHAFGGRHFLLSSDGADLVTGTARAALLPEAPATQYRGHTSGVFHLARRSSDGRYWFAVLGSRNETGPATWAYFAVCVVVTTLLLLFSLFYLVFPLRRIRDALRSFGDGQMTMRLISRRKDEIGQLAGTFDSMAERIEQSFRTERLLLQDVSHELRAPLARLSLAVHLAKREREDELLSQVETNVRKLSALVGEITDFHQRWSTIENSRQFESIDLKQLVEDSVRESNLEASSRSIRITLEAAPVVLENARPDLIGRVIENVLRNAIIHSQTGSQIEVSLTRNDSDAIVSVRDFGTGVSGELLERIFDPFYKGHSPSAEHSGLGLGLSIARRGVQWHGGSLRAENALPGLRLVAIFPLGVSSTRAT